MQDVRSSRDGGDTESARIFNWPGTESQGEVLHVRTERDIIISEIINHFFE